MVNKDTIAQMLMGNELKQDQFEFFYNSVKVIFDSALCDDFVNFKTLKGNGKIIEETVIPELIAYKACMRIRGIKMRKADEAKKAKEKAERDGENPNLPKVEEEKDPMKMTEAEIYSKKLNDAEKGGLTMTDAEKIRREEDKERKKYGRYWVFEGLFNEKNRDNWEALSDKLMKVNDHVLQDVEDHIILKGFGKQAFGSVKLREKIDADHKMRIERKRSNMKDEEEAK